MDVGLIIFLVALGVVALAVIATSIHIVPQAHAYVVERLGAYHATWNTGLHFKVPFIDKIAKKVSLMEKVADFEPQAVITTPVISRSHSSGRSSPSKTTLSPFRRGSIAARSALGCSIISLSMKCS